MADLGNASGHSHLYKTFKSAEAGRVSSAICEDSGRLNPAQLDKQRRERQNSG